VAFGVAWWLQALEERDLSTTDVVLVEEPEEPHFGGHRHLGRWEVARQVEPEEPQAPLGAVVEAAEAGGATAAASDPLAALLEQVVVERAPREAQAPLPLAAAAGELPWATLRARWVTLRARWVTLRARWVMLRARWVTLRARWVTLRARWGTLRAHWVTLRARWVTTLRTSWVTLRADAESFLGDAKSSLVGVQVPLAVSRWRSLPLS
jgi:hypothetical protein